MALSPASVSPAPDRSALHSLPTFYRLSGTGQLPGVTGTGDYGHLDERALLLQSSGGRNQSFGEPNTFL